MHDMRLTVHDIGNELAVRKLTSSEVAAVSGAFYSQYPAPQPGLYQDQVIIQGGVVPVP